MASTLKDVAAHAGVSIKTVSNVANGNPCVAPATRARVLTSIAALNYRPNLGARHLRKARVGVLALAIPEVMVSYFAEIAHAIIGAAATHSYTVLIDHTGGDRTNETLAAHGLRPHLIDGVILSPLALEMDDLQPDHVGVPIVLLGERLYGSPWDHVVIDNMAAARLATAHLLSLGRRRVAVIGAQEQVSGETSRIRLRGYREALTAAGYEIDPALIAATPWFHRADGAVAMQQLLALDAPPDAVFCFNDLLALGAMRTLHESGVHIPDDIAVVGFDDIREAQVASPALTTVRQSLQDMGRTMARMLLDRIDGRPTESVRILPVETVRRASA
jgi:DNA-binding LacI/PurR family transcriptional regulator